MSEDKSQKTEKPTPKKLRDARKKGQVAQSKEIVSTAILVTMFGYIGFTWHYQLESMHQLLLIPTNFYDMPFRDALARTADMLIREFMFLSLPFVAIGFVTAIVATVMQFGLLFSFESLKPDFNKLNPVEGAKKIFAMKNLFELLKSIVKVVVLSILLYFLMQNSLRDLVKVPYCDIYCLLEVNNDLLLKLVIYLIPALIVISCVDFAIQKMQFIKDQMMTKEEIKREYKDSEGDPHIKGQRRQLQREMANEDIAGKVKTSTVVITAGPKLSVVLWYEKDTTPLPMIMLMGKEGSAKNIVKFAHAADKPVRDEPAIARALAEKGQTGGYIPPELIEDIATVLREVV